MFVVGVDVAREAHQYIVLDESRNIVEQGEVENSGRALQSWCKRLRERQPDTPIVVGLERNLRLSLKLEEIALKRGFQVRQVAPDQVKGFRESVLRQHNKTDVTDAHAIAVLLSHTVEHARSTERPRAAMAQAARHRLTLVRQRTRHINGLRAAVASYWPEAGRRLFKGVWLYVMVLFALKPSPEEVVAAGVQGMLEFFRAQGSPVKRKTVEKIVLAAEGCVTVQSPLRQVLLLEAQQHARILLELSEQIEEVNRVINELVDEDVAALELSRTKGVSKQQIATVVGELQDVSLFATEPHAASFAGLALCREQTGTSKNRKVVQRKCNRVLQAAMMSIASTRIKHDVESHTYYAKKIAEGKKHRQALRSLARHIFRRFFRALCAVKRREQAATVCIR